MIKSVTKRARGDGDVEPLNGPLRGVGVGKRGKRVKGVIRSQGSPRTMPEVLRGKLGLERGRDFAEKRSLHVLKKKLGGGGKYKSL